MELIVLGFIILVLTGLFYLGYKDTKTIEETEVEDNEFKFLVGTKEDMKEGRKKKRKEFYLSPKTIEEWKKELEETNQYN